MRRIAFLIGFAILASTGFAQTEATTLSLAQADGTSTTWDGEVNVYRDGSGNMVFEDINTEAINLSDLMSATGTTTFTEAKGSTLTLTERLGVGTTTPTEIIEASGEDNGDVSILVTNTGTTSYSRAVLAAAAAGDIKVAVGAFNSTFDDTNKDLWEGKAFLYTTTPTLGLGLCAAAVTGDILFLTGGYSGASNERMRIDQDGLVGIGTAAPTYGLHIVGDSAASGGVWLERDTTGVIGPSINLACDTTDTSWTERTVGAGYVNWQTENSSGTMVGAGTIQCNVTDRTSGTHDSNLAFYAYDGGAAATPMMVVMGTGVGIGTASPSTALEVDGTVTADNAALTSLTVSGAVSITSLTVSGGQVVMGDTQVYGAVEINEEGGDNDFRVESDTNTAALFVRGSNGFIGMGTSSPADELQVVAGDGGFSAFRIGESNEGQYFRVNVAEGGAGGGLTSFQVNGTEYLNFTVTSPGIIFNDLGEDHDFRIESDTNASAFYVEGSSGLVGIGTASPSTALEVDGTVTATAFAASTLTVSGATTITTATVSGTLTATAFVGDGTGITGIGAGDASGPGSSTDNAVARFDGTGGKTLQNSAVIISETNDVTGIDDLTMTGDLVVSNAIQWGSHRWGAQGSTITMHGAYGNTQSFILSSNTTITHSLVDPLPLNTICYLVIEQPSSGGPYTVIWDSTFEFPGGTDPAVTAAAGAVDIFAIMQVPFVGAYGNFVWVVGQDFK